MANSLLNTLLSLGRTLLKTALQSPTRSAGTASTSGTAGRSTARRPSSSSRGSAAGVADVPLATALAAMAYEPDKDGDADPGEVAWTWVPYEEDASQGKDRPVLVIGRDGGRVLVAPMTSKDHDRDAEQEARWGRYWMDVGSGPWDPKGRPSEVRLNRVLAVPAASIRREGATMDRAIYREVAKAMLDLHDSGRA